MRGGGEAWRRERGWNFQPGKGPLRGQDLNEGLKEVRKPVVWMAREEPGRENNQQVQRP